ncbi:hypothetical protein Acr_17g0006290 [Actinidia rufa]|uniref:Uncharacterized protein n=1 Tax=Actinidia rufa TaxID=165716 RepID=A0A7J0G2P6_9ERIC|nr:hypothetical protein Acr_17g0006290 [Actinidia rufa]
MMSGKHNEMPFLLLGMKGNSKDGRMAQSITRAGILAREGSIQAAKIRVEQWVINGKFNSKAAYDFFKPWKLPLIWLNQGFDPHTDPAIDAAIVDGRVIVVFWYYLGNPQLLFQLLSPWSCCCAETANDDSHGGGVHIVLLWLFSCPMPGALTRSVLKMVLLV